MFGSIVGQLSLFAGNISRRACIELFDLESGMIFEPFWIIIICRQYKMLISHVDLHHAATFADLFWWSDANKRNWWLLIADGLFLRFDYGGYFEVCMGNYSILNIATVMRLWPSRCVYCAKRDVSLFHWHLSTQTCQEENLAINGILLTNYHFHPFSFA